MIVYFNEFFIAFLVRLLGKGATVKIPVIVKNRFTSLAGQIKLTKIYIVQIVKIWKHPLRKAKS